MLTGCANRHERVPAAAAVTPATSSYIDLEPGWRLRVVTPLLKSGGYRLRHADQEVNGNTVTLSAGDDFLGYEVAYYAVGARGVKFVSAEVSKGGQTTPQPAPLVRLFAMPRGVRHVRLIYLLRASDADHDMAVAAAQDMSALEALTRRVLGNPAEFCKGGRDAACAWIPAGIAVVPEVHRTDGWVPAR